jgi:SAM-dependent methyltransferase
MLQKLGFDVTTITVRPWQDATQMDMHDLQYPPESFDAIYGCQVYEHSYAPWLALMESWVVLKPHGILFANMPLPTDNDVVTHPTMLTLEQWSRIYEYCGFKVNYSASRGFAVNCLCEDDKGQPWGESTHHRVTCNIIEAEKTEVRDGIMKSALEKLMTIHVLPEPSSTVD